VSFSGSQLKERHCWLQVGGPNLLPIARSFHNNGRSRAPFGRGIKRHQIEWPQQPGDEGGEHE
jgi:hypothetical protein